MKRIALLLALVIVGISLGQFSAPDAGYDAGDLVSTDTTALSNAMVDADATLTAADVVLAADILATSNSIPLVNGLTGTYVIYGTAANGTGIVTNSMTFANGLLTVFP